MNKTLRPYQQLAIESIQADMKKGVNKLLMVLPTGAGKTFCAVKAVSEFKRKIWLTHTIELLEQSGTAFLQELYPNLSIQTMIDTYGGLSDYLTAIRSHGMFGDSSDNELLRNVGIVKAEAFDIEADIVLASMQTLHRRLDRISPEAFDAVIVDEAHMATAKTVVKSINHFNPKLLLGLTATPHRSDGALLGDVFDKISFQYSINDAIQDGYLCELDALRIQSNISLDNVRTTAGEFNQKDLKQTVDTPERNQLLVQKYKQYADGKQNIVFCVDVDHAQNVCETFKDNGYKAEFIVGDTELTPDRKAVINRFKSGETQVLVNCMILTAGFDYPGVQVITLACPTKSLTKFMQQVGRGTRTLSGVIDSIDDPKERIKAIKASYKPHCTVLDIVDTTNRHKIVNTWDLDRDKPIEQRVFTTKEKKDVLIEVREKRKFEAQTKKDTKVNLFELPKVEYSTSIKMRDAATEKQIAFLKNLGYDVDNNTYTKGSANQIISSHNASDAQIKALKYMGYDVSRGVTIGESQLAFKAHEDRQAKKKETKELGNRAPIQGLN